MEILFELIFDLFVEGNKSLAESQRAPRWVRITALAVLGILFLALFGGLIAVGLLFLLSAEGGAVKILVGIFFLLLAIFLLVLGGIKAIRFLRSMHENW